MYSETSAWEYVRKAPELIAMFNTLGEGWVDALNQELHAAQRARKQPVADGYKHRISINDDRIRMRIWAFTARAMAHEAKHQSMLRTMRTSGFDFKQKGRAKWDWGKKAGSKKSGGGSKSASGGGSDKASNRQPMDPKREARLRRILVTLDALAERGSTEGERKLSAEKARRVRSELGE
jgi:hypothetical protein